MGCKQQICIVRPMLAGNWPQLPFVNDFFPMLYVKATTIGVLKRVKSNCKWKLPDNHLSNH
jgi:hypothetical protein